MLCLLSYTPTISQIVTWLFGFAAAPGGTMSLTMGLPG